MPHLRSRDRGGELIATEARARGRTLVDVCRWMCETPAQLMSLHNRKGRIAAGYDADFTVVDLKRRATISNAQAGSKAGWTPYDGMQVTGWPVGTVVRGKRVMWEGEIVTPGQGEPVLFAEALPG